MNYKEIAKETIGNLYKAHNSIRKSGIDEKLIALVELRISQINGCAYCCSYHAKELSDFGFEQDVINRLPGWKHTNAFTDQQKLVLEWAETIIYSKDDWQNIKSKLIEQFTEREFVELTASITLMNTLNKLRITLAEKD
ncbi:AhpD family alkylhydroperoxidase [Chryseobacterium bernardetii]|uniref:AhpD family alkylhydroperoxidase n=2 Tax=Chryseobacterium TaxID=59732 RepID=A0A543ELE8_9FLAO|nr:MULTISPECIES: carboxymuconolactone decarboxylase family protein [Chryseobacterium]MDR6368795.1 AhpD family alkylhydroperoxidase [Chryseobacterium vietnamense]MDR6440282.1 AhpD family alkylhydroperoxidase [Chryseobacterium bernardetii]MDR6489053.1 AhpD family alkylhydroperoxidase [Chryseobacterium vietnamense]TQM22406.1 AhpD family alkylhydroperoxidase [Chryseobacterium aquifrigidense]